jgi:hypothetical protein
VEVIAALVLTVRTFSLKTPPSIEAASMNQSIQYVALAKDVEHWDADVKSEFNRALTNFLAVAIHATLADDILAPTVKAFRVKSLAEVLRQVTDVVTSGVTHIDLAADILQDANLAVVIDSCIQYAFEVTQRTVQRRFESPEASSACESNVAIRVGDVRGKRRAWL